MERELWIGLKNLASALDGEVPRGLYRTSEIVSVYWWAVIHDRPVVWAVNACNWPRDLKSIWLPSQSTMSRRLRQACVIALLQQVEAHFMALHCVRCCWVHCIDGKPLVVGGNSKDRDATFGRGAGSVQRGYKLHAIWGDAPLPLAWMLCPLNRSEKTVSRELIPRASGVGYLLGDGEYDCNALYELAAQAGFQLLARKRKGAKLGHRRQSQHRIRSIQLLQKPFGAALYKKRNAIEQNFGNCTSFGGGLAPLPAWVRTMPRVLPWVYSKLLINAARKCRHSPNWSIAVA